MRRIAALILACIAAFPAWAQMREQAVEWTIGKQRFAGVLVYDDAGAANRPGLVLMPNWRGVSPEAIDLARQVAGKDYVVLVADVFGKQVRPHDDAQSQAAVKQAYADGGHTLRVRARHAVDALKAQAGKAPLDPARIGALGFCFGGSVALELARSGAELRGGVVSFHGQPSGYVPADGPIRTPVLVLNGADDADVSEAQISAFEKEMTAAKADWQFVNLGGARHCFAQPEDIDAPADSNCRYDPRAAGRAFAMMRGFFAERFAAP